MAGLKLEGLHVIYKCNKYPERNFMKLLKLKVNYEWYTPGGRHRHFYDFSWGMSQMLCIDNIKKTIKRRIRHENYTITKMEFVDEKIF